MLWYDFYYLYECVFIPDVNKISQKKTYEHQTSLHIDMDEAEDRKEGEKR